MLELLHLMLEERKNCCKPFSWKNYRTWSLIWAVRWVYYNWQIACWYLPPFCWFADERDYCPVRCPICTELTVHHVLIEFGDINDCEVACTDNSIRHTTPWFMRQD